MKKKITGGDKKKTVQSKQKHVQRTIVTGFCVSVLFVTFPATVVHRLAPMSSSLQHRPFSSINFAVPLSGVTTKCWTHQDSLHIVIFKPVRGQKQPKAFLRDIETDLC